MSRFLDFERSDVITCNGVCVILSVIFEKKNIFLCNSKTNNCRYFKFLPNVYLYMTIFRIHDTIFKIK